MKSTLTICLELGSILIFTVTPCFSEEANTISTESNKYLDAIRTFADNVLKYGRDTYGPKHTPLFVDGLNIHTHEPVKWISPKGGDPLTATETEEWILSNFASQQTLLRTLDGLSTLTGDPKYRDAAKEAVKYAFENLTAPNGLFYWGHYVAYDAQKDEVKYAATESHILKVHYPYYDLMWQVNPGATKRFIDAFWSAHVIDWSNLDFNRIARYSDSAEEPWEHEYSERPTFFQGKRRGGGFFNNGTSLAYAAATLSHLSKEELPLVWSKRLIKRFVDTRHPATGMIKYMYNQLPFKVWRDDDNDHFSDPRSFIFPAGMFAEMRNKYQPEDVWPHQWMSVLLVGDMLGEQGEDFVRWAKEELSAWGKSSYRRQDNSFIPIITDGTNIEGYVLKEDCPIGNKGNVAVALFADLNFFWAYATAYRITGDKFMWQMARDIAIGNKLGDIGDSSTTTADLNADTTCSDVYALLGFLELFSRTKRPHLLRIARRVADNILQDKFCEGFFVPSKNHIFTRFDSFEPLALLHLVTAIESQSASVPRVWPSSPLFVPPYRFRRAGVDRLIIYTLTASPEVPMSLQEAAASGNVEMVKSLLQRGKDVDSFDNDFRDTALQRAAISGYKDIAQFLIAKGAQIDYMSPDSPLHYAVRYNHKDIVDLLLANGADVNVKNRDGQSSIDAARRIGNNEIVELLLAKTVSTSIHGAASYGSLAKAKAFLEQGTDVNTKDEQGMTPLLHAVVAKHIDVAEFLIENGADVNLANNQGVVPLFRALWNTDLDMLELLLKKGANVSAKHPKSGFTALHWAAMMDNKESVKLLLNAGADVNAKSNTGEMPLDVAAIWGASTEMAELLMAKDAEVSSIHAAAYVGDLDKVRAFIDEGVEVDKKSGMIAVTALHSAAAAGRDEIVEFLISKGSDVNAKNGPGQTPLHMAAENGHIDVVELLLKSGADANAKDARRRARTPLDLAQSAKHIEIVALLQKHMLVHDVKVAKISATPDCTKGETVSIAISLENLGGYGASCTVTLTDTTSGSEIARQSTTIRSKNIAASEANLMFDDEPAGICHFGNRLAAGDVNGDGIADLLVSASHWPDDTYQGKVCLYYGGANMDATADKTFVGENAYDRFGDNSGFIADLNNDTFGDVIIGAPDYNGEGPEFNGDGRVYIYYGGTDMTDTAPNLILDPPVGGGGFYGYRVIAGDVNNDGWLDLIVPAVIWNNYTGRVYLYYGPLASDTKPDKIFTGEGSGNVFGAYPNVGDIDNDGYDDLLLTNRYYPDLNSDTRGRGYLYWGASGTSMSETPALIFDPPELGTPTPEFGTSNDVKDINNDNYADVVIGARHCNSYDGRAYLYWGKSRSSFTATPDMTFAAQRNAQLGGSVRIAHVDGDQYRDIVLGGWNYNSQQGRFYLYYGSNQGDMDVEYDNTFDGPEADFDAFQHIVADFNNDGHGDLAIGGTGYNNEAGRVLLWFGPFGTSTDITFNWDTSDTSIGQHTLKVEVQPVLAKQNTQNNIKTFTIDVKEPLK